MSGIRTRVAKMNTLFCSLRSTNWAIEAYWKKGQSFKYILIKIWYFPCYHRANCPWCQSYVEADCTVCSIVQDQKLQTQLFWDLKCVRLVNLYFAIKQKLFQFVHDSQFFSTNLSVECRLTLLLDCAWGGMFSLKYDSERIFFKQNYS